MTLTNEEVIGLMYKGEQNRDASSKVRGFLFQDLVAIDELLKDETEYICTEYVEDVFCAKANKIVIIQAKYYPKTDVNQDANISAIMRDLYYQFLRLNVYGYSGDVIPQLSIYSKKDVNDVTLEQLKKYIGVDRDKKPDFKKNNIEDLLDSLSKSKFRGSFHLNKKMKNYVKEKGWYYINGNNKSPSWSGVEFLYKFLINNKSVGPYAKKANQDEVQLGDIAQLSFDGNKFGHTLVVVGIDNHYSLSGIKIASHTLDSYNKPISEYGFKDIRFAHIEGVR